MSIEAARAGQAIGQILRDALLACALTEVDPNLMDSELPLQLRARVIGDATSEVRDLLAEVVMEGCDDLDDQDVLALVRVRNDAILAHMYEAGKLDLSQRIEAAIRHHAQQRFGAEGDVLAALRELGRSEVSSGYWTLAESVRARRAVYGDFSRLEILRHLWPSLSGDESGANFFSQKGESHSRLFGSIAAWLALGLNLRIKSLWLAKGLTLYGANEDGLCSLAAPSREAARKGVAHYEMSALMHLDACEKALLGGVPADLSPLADEFDVLKIMLLAERVKASRPVLQTSALERHEAAVMQAELEGDALVEELSVKEFELGEKPVQMPFQLSGFPASTLYLACREHTSEEAYTVGMAVLVCQLALELQPGHTVERKFLDNGDHIMPLSITLDRVTGELNIGSLADFSLKDVFKACGIEGMYQLLRREILKTFLQAAKGGDLQEVDPLEVRRRQAASEEEARIAELKANFGMPTYTGLNFSAQFEKDWKSLPRDVRKRAYATFETYLENERHHSLHNEKLNHSKRDLHSLRVSRSYRIIFEFTGDGEERQVEFIGIGPHDIYGRF